MHMVNLSPYYCIKESASYSTKNLKVSNVTFFTYSRQILCLEFLYCRAITGSADGKVFVKGIPL